MGFPLTGEPLTSPKPLILRGLLHFSMVLNLFWGMNSTLRMGSAKGSFPFTKETAPSIFKSTLGSLQSGRRNPREHYDEGLLIILFLENDGPINTRPCPISK